MELIKFLKCVLNCIAVGENLLSKLPEDYVNEKWINIIILSAVFAVYIDNIVLFYRCLINISY